MGSFGGPVGVPHGREPRGWRAVTGSCQRFTALVAKITYTASMQDGFAARRAVAAVASAKRWRGRLRRANRRRFSGSISESASMKISTVSSLPLISTRTGVSPKSTSWRHPVRSANDGVALAYLSSLERTERLYQGGRNKRPTMLLDKLNKPSPTPVITAAQGGAGDGGATLTAFGADVLERYQRQTDTRIDSRRHKGARSASETEATQRTGTEPLADQPDPTLGVGG
jgi:hypothetical protein